MPPAGLGLRGGKGGKFSANPPGIQKTLPGCMGRQNQQLSLAGMMLCGLSLTDFSHCPPPVQPSAGPGF